MKTILNVTLSSLLLANLSFAQGSHSVSNNQTGTGGSNTSLVNKGMSSARGALSRSGTSTQAPESLRKAGVGDGNPNAKLRSSAQETRSRTGNNEGPIDPGGGLVLINQKTGKPETLGDFGMIHQQVEQLLGPIKEIPQPYTFSPQTKEALKEVLNELPLADNMTREGLYRAILALNDRTTYIKQDSISQDDYQKIIATYSRLMSKQGYELDPSLALLPAFSKADASGKQITYIMPSFDGRSVEHPKNQAKEFLIPRQQALNVVGFKMA